MKKTLFFLALTFLLWPSCKKEKCNSCSVFVVNATLSDLAVVELDDAFIGFVGPQDTVEIRLTDSGKHRLLCSDDGNLSADALYIKVQCPDNCADKYFFYNP